MTKKVSTPVSNLVLDILNQGTCLAEYQPIVNIVTGEVYAYEALARFSLNDKAYSPDEVFSLCYSEKESLLLLELIAKDRQFQDRPLGNKKIFVNISPYSLKSIECRKKWINIFKNETNLVVEITESRKNSSMLHTMAFISELQKNNIKYAIDDLFQERVIFSLDVLSRAPILKIDKGFLYKAKRDPAYLEILKGVVSYAQISNKLLIVEGVEEFSQQELLRDVGVVYVQGHYFKNMYMYCTGHNKK